MPEPKRNPDPHHSAEEGSIHQLTCSLRVLVVEDDPDDAALVEEMLRTSKIEMSVAGTAHEGLQLLHGRSFDAVLLDLELPDSQGIETLEAVRGEAPGLPIVVVTGHDDEGLGVAAVARGAQDYLRKSDLSASLLSRAIRYAVERHRLRAEISEAHLRTLRDTEIAAMGSLGPPVPATARRTGTKALREQFPGHFEHFCEAYREIFEGAIEVRTYRVHRDVGERSRAMAAEMGVLLAGPRDVIDIHTEALGERLRGVPTAKAKVLLEEGRLLSLELMGYLVSYYRSFALGGAKDGARRRERKEN